MIVEQYRTEHEPSHHWKLKKEFMVRNKDRFPEQMLVSVNTAL